MATNSTVISFYEECMVRRPGGITTDGCTKGMIYRAFKEWCKENNNGFAKTAREFRDELSAHLGTTFEEMTVHCKTGRYYKEFTLNKAAMELYRAFI